MKRLRLTFLSKEILEFEDFLKDYFIHRFKKLDLKELKNSIEYTLFAPCKRFRPALAIGVCQALGVHYKQCFPLAGAVELIHTASLIHDDLMDNDNQRRNQPAHHIAFGRNEALLAGDSLFMESFYLLCYFKQKFELIQKVAKASSISGLMGGQALDLREDSSIQAMHLMKTGALMQACVEGVCCLCDEEPKQTKALQQFSFNLGQAFQLADDWEDRHLKEKASILNKMSEDEVLLELEKKTEKNLNILDLFQGKTQILKKLVLFNQSRVLSKNS